MNIKQITEEFDYSRCKIIDNHFKEQIIDKMLKTYSNVNDIHYLWSHLKISDKNNKKIKIIADNNYYLSLLKKIKKEKIYVIIDKECFCDTEEHILIRTDSIAFLKVLCKYYWELDEIYVFDKRCSFLISVNHMFDIQFVGEQICKLFEKINNDILIKKYIIKEY